MLISFIKRPFQYLYDRLLSVPVRIKIGGMVMLPVLILGFSLNYWVRISLSDWLSYILSDERVEAAMQAGGRSVTLVTLLAAMLCIYIAVVLTFILTRPILELRDIAIQVAEGKLDSRAKVWSNDEIGDVTQAVNRMIDRLLEGQEKLQKANHRLSAMNQVAMVAGRELDLHEVMQAILEGVLEIMGLQSGWVYLLESEGKFSLYGVKNVPEDLQPLIDQRTTDLCTCQERLLSSGIAENPPCVEACSMLRQSDLDHYAFSQLTIPLGARGQKFGMIVLLCEPSFSLSQVDSELVSAIAAQASEIVANAWLHVRLVEKEAARRFLLDSLVRAEDEERKRLARELHDGAGQTLTSLLVRLKAFEKQAQTDEMRTSINEMLQAASETIDQLHELSHRLRPAALEEFGLDVALEMLLQDTLDDVSITYQYRIDLGEAKIHPDMETTLYRIAQESLANILKHANASCVEVELFATPISICLRIDDNGQGFDVEAATIGKSNRHLGLLHIQERAEMMGGSLVLFSGPQAGTSVQVRLPLLEEVA